MDVVEESTPEDHPTRVQERALRRRHFIGLCLVVIVVFIWVSSSVVIQYIFEDSDFDKPFFLTYLSTSLFSVYLLGFVVRYRQWTSNLGFPFSTNYAPLVDDKERLADSASELPINVAIPGAIVPPTVHKKMSVYETLKLSAMFCPIWFVANYTYNLGLSMTSVSSNTILSTLSGIFAIILSSLMGVDRFTIWKLLAALVTIGGVVMVSLADRDDDNGSESILGDVFTVIGAAIYAFYCTLLKKKIVHEDRLIMPMFFGFVGLINFVILWPFLLMWSAFKIETLQLPHWEVWLFLLANGLIGTVLSDILEAWSIILTTPLINTLGLSLTIPMAMVSDVLRKTKSFSPVYYLGSFFVFIGFVLVNLSSGIFEQRFAGWRKKWVEKCRRMASARAE